VNIELFLLAFAAGNRDILLYKVGCCPIKEGPYMIKMVHFGLAALCAAAVSLSSSTVVRAQGENEYVSTKGCGMCHSAVKKTWDIHGHSKMLRPVLNGQAPQGVEVTPPDGKTWSDLSYLIGGNNIYARFADSKGYVVTGPKAQWSLVGKTLTPFKPDVAPGTLKYDCIKCHVVGWRESGAYEGGVQNNLEGIPGVWFENSVGCEACHGMGHQHVILKDKANIKKNKGDLKITVDKSLDACGTCHKRTDDNSLLLVGKDLIQSRQQYTEFKLNRKGKFKFTCVMCHDPHVTSADESGFVKKCTDCHTGKFAKPVKIAAMENLACTDCHMPYADRGAYDSMTKGYHRGDMRSHLFGITSDPAYVLDNGSGKATVNADGFARLTVDMTCGQCHASGAQHDMTHDAMLAMAKKIH